MSLGVYPGTFNPPTVGHLAIMDAAITQYSLTELHVVVSRDPLGKSRATRPTLEDRIEVIEASTAHLRVVSVHITEDRLIADIAAGYDVVVMGADKWHQLHDLGFYENATHRERALAALPRLAVAPRGELAIPPDHRLDVPDHVDVISSTAARAGRHEWMTPAARESGHWA